MFHVQAKKNHFIVLPCSKVPDIPAALDHFREILILNPDEIVPLTLGVVTRLATHDRHLTNDEAVDRLLPFPLPADRLSFVSSYYDLEKVCALDDVEEGRALLMEVRVSISAALEQHHVEVGDNGSWDSVLEVYFKWMVFHLSRLCDKLSSRGEVQQTDLLYQMESEHFGFVGPYEITSRENCLKCMEWFKTTFTEKAGVVDGSEVEKDPAPDCFVLERVLEAGLKVCAIAKKEESGDSLVIAFNVIRLVPVQQLMEEEVSSLPQPDLEVELQVTKVGLGHEAIPVTGSKIVTVSGDFCFAMLLQLFMDHFTDLPNFSITTPQGDLIANEDRFRVYLDSCSVSAAPVVFVTRVTSLSAEPKSTAPVEAVHRSQQVVSEAVLGKALKALGCDGHPELLANQFTSMKFLIMVPKFSTLRQQTMDRLRDFEELVGTESPDTVVESSVMLYPVVSENSKLKMQEMEEQLLANSRMLFVLVVDECHYAPTASAIPMLHKPALCSLSNFLVLLVSATPFNCITDRTRIAPDNQVKWADVLANSQQRTTYVGFEYYARSIAFRCPDSSFLATVGDTDIKIDLHFGDREFADFDVLYTEMSVLINDRLNQHGWTCELRHNTDSKTSLTCTTRRWKDLQIHCAELFVNGAVNVMRMLGFVKVDGGVFSAPQNANFPTVNASSSTTVDEDAPLALQHFRSDEGFVVFKSRVEAAIPELKNTVGKTAVPLKKSIDAFKLPSFWATVPFLGSNVLVDTPSMKARNGFIVITDYVMSLAYFAVRPAEGAITADHARRLVSILGQCCYFVDNGELCNLLEVVDVILDKMIKLMYIQRDESKPPLSDEPMDVLASILKEKRQIEFDNATTESQTWYTESDRIVKMLLEQRSPSPMILLRVYDNDENLSMQRILRHALLVSFPAAKEGPYKPKFSIIGDIANTNLFQAIEPYFKEEFKVDHADFGVCTLRDVVDKKRGITTKGDLKYEDLDGVPCLVILCEKGRMGDTFPHSLRVLDMRLRTANSGSTVIQELGRMCRYPKPSKDPNASIVVGRADEVVDFVGLFPHGAMVYNDKNNDYLGIAESIASLAYLMKHTRADFDVDTWKLRALQYPLPTALMSVETMSMIAFGVDKREAALFDSSDSCLSLPLERRRNLSRIMQSMRITRMDDYLTTSCKQTTAGPFCIRINKPSPHYDASDPVTIHSKRILLFAECQIGKTGTFLDFLNRLSGLINYVDMAQPSPPSVSGGTPWIKWLLPYWRDMSSQDALDYSSPRSGKYIPYIAEQRLECALGAMAVVQGRPQQDGHNTVFRREFENLIKKLEYPGSTAAKAMLSALVSDDRIICPFSTLTTLGVNVEALRKYLDWDGRLHGNLDVHGVVSDVALTTAQNASLLPADQLHEFFMTTSLQRCSFGSLVNKRFWGEEAERMNGQPAIIPNPFTPAVDLTANFCKSPRTVVMAPPNDPEPYAVVCSMSTWESSSFEGSFRAHFPSSLVEAHVGELVVGNMGNPTSFVQAVCDAIRGHQSEAMLKYWVFTPSYIGKHGLKDKYLHRASAFTDGQGGAWEPWRKYVQVLVVRDSQFDMYREYFGSEYIILSLPPSVVYDDLRFTPEVAGPGFARLFIQQFAEWAQLEAVWMIDDNVKSCYKLTCAGDVMEQANTRFTDASFGEVMLHIEAIFDGNLQSIVPDQFSAPADSRKAPSVPLRGTPRPVGSTAADNLREYVGYKSQYGAIGMARTLQQHNPNVVNPIKVAHSVYSFFLFNVAAAKDHSIYYPPRKTMEDIEMNFMMEEKGLVVCKLQMFSHLKPARGLRKAIPEEFPEIHNLLQPYHPSQVLMRHVADGNGQQREQALLAIDTELVRLNKVSTDCSPSNCHALVCFVHQMPTTLHPEFCLYTYLLMHSNLYLELSGSTEVFFLCKTSALNDLFAAVNRSGLIRQDFQSCDVSALYRRPLCEIEEPAATTSGSGLRDSRLFPPFAFYFPFFLLCDQGHCVDFIARK